MSKRPNLKILLVAALAVLGGASVLPVGAAAPTNTFPGGAEYIDNRSHTIPANMGLWYRFDYRGGRTPILVTLVNGTDSGLGFDVYTPFQISNWWEIKPIGRGTPQPLDCGSLKPRTYGDCKSRDLRWLGDFDAAGTYYVRVVNFTGSDLAAQLLIEGPGVLLGGGMPAPPRPTATPISTPVPTAVPPPVVVEPSTGVDPGHANVLDGLVHSIPARSSKWFRFGYAGDKSQIIVTLLYAAYSGLAFNVYTPEQILDWWEVKPIGRGTIEILDCESNRPTYLGKCQSNYLRWIGKFNASGTYYVELVNYNDTPMTAQFTIEGSGVSLQ